MKLIRMISIFLLLVQTFSVTDAPRALAAEDGSKEDKEKQAEEFPITTVVVTAPAMTNPLTVKTNPKAPRQPLPPNDGGSYLKNIPGFSTVLEGGIDGDPVLRGLGGSRLNVLIDGAQLKGACPARMDPAPSYASPETFDKITVLKGPETVLYGNGNLAGTVLFERITPRFDKPGQRFYSSLLFGSFGRNDQLYDITTGDKGGYVRIIRSRTTSDNYKDGNGNPVFSRYAKNNSTYIVGLTPDANTLYEYTADLGAAQSAHTSNSASGKMSHDSAQLDKENYNFRFEKKNVSKLIQEIDFTAYSNFEDHIMDTHTMRPWVKWKSGSVMNPTVTARGARLAAKLDVNKDTQATVGMDYLQERHNYRCWGMYDGLDGPRVPTIEFDNLGIFGEVKRNVDAQSRIISGLRFDKLNAENKWLDPDWHEGDDDYRHKGVDKTYSAFLRYEHDASNAPVTTYVGVGHVERPADFVERGGTGRMPLITDSFYVKPEKSTQLDTGLSYKSGKLKANLSLFYAKINDYILLKASKDSVTTYDAWSANNVDATLYGGEADAAYALSEHWTLNATLAATHGNNDTEHKPLPQIPALEGTVGIKYNNKKLEAYLFWRGVQAQDRVDINYGNSTGFDVAKTPGYGVLSLNTSYHVSDRVVISAGVDNILNKLYAEHLSCKNTGIKYNGSYLFLPSTQINAPGRNIWVKTSYRF
ncbi:MAG: TonB-dependent copper receptor [Pelosinus sp.]|nr:TonB-dependent copper receptor [Pelosinus sp.]